jgi:transposase
MRKSPKFSPKVVERAVRMVLEAKDQYPSQWAAIESIAGKSGWARQSRGRPAQRSQRAAASSSPWRTLC